MQQLILDIRPDAPPQFGNFLPGQNAEAVDALARFAGGEAVEPLIYLWGEAGSGKSHLLKASVDAAQGGVYCPGEPLPETLPPLLAVDDVDALGPEAQVGLFNLINQAREGAGRIVMAGKLPPARLALRQDLTTRLGWGLVFALKPLTDQERTAALRSRAAARGMRLPDEVAGYMLNHCRRDLPGLLATLDALDLFSLSRKRAVTLPLLREFLQQ
ncbi:regulatory inactivation of DnaA Hda protein [Sulfuritortus calidifontis]|uniref:Regulatory inactivation of DnaA Hda protein n=1 Tax=Sulfuritortus calidifontis TaxID=1914471 RepID=A0A4R3K0E3_9PROT|nr:DnaA regulatory inactivator Hda [Sulfuritortus calidifontis]TCS73351.1 regulatory inactivation of DnaA Hda protein [Sulfuritortus calidifontis]